MPRNGSVGFSDNTPLKQEIFQKIMGVHMRIVWNLLRKAHWMEPFYLYGDLNAGPGRYRMNDQDIFGSPLIALAIAGAVHLPLHAFFCEEDAASLHALRSELCHAGMRQDLSMPDVYYRDPAQIAILYFGDYNLHARAALTHFRHSAKTVYGMLYSDENGCCPPFDLLGEYAQTLPKLDLLIHVGATPIKRQYYSPVHPLLKRLDEMVATVPKDYWFIREPYGRHQWTFLIGTNWNAFPKFRSAGFWPLDSPQGADVLRRLSLNRKDYYGNGQGDLFSEWH